MAESIKQVVKRNLWYENQVVRQILGICSSLAVTNLMVNSLVMGIGLTFTVTLSSLTLSLLRNMIPPSHPHDRADADYRRLCHLV